MKLRTKFILFVSILHLITLALTFVIFHDHTLLFLAAEVLIILSVVLAAQLYQQLIQPLQMLLQGADVIRDRDFNIKFLPTGNYEMDQLVSVYNSMIDVLRTERTKQEQQHFFLEKLIYTSPTGIVILDFEERVQQVNPKALQLLAIAAEEIIGKFIHTLSHPIVRQINDLKPGEAKTITLHGATYKLQKSHFIDRGFPRHFIMIEELTAEIAAAEKRAYGKVIRMMAHEVNNTIGPVNSIIESALKKKDVWKEEGNDSLQQAFQIAIARNQNLNVFMRNFADVVRIPEPHSKKIDLHRLIKAVATLLEVKAEEKQIRLHYHFKSALFDIVADEQQMEQVLINIVKNAIEAIEGAGDIHFYTDAVTNRLRITDTGKGLQVESGDQLFSPFFSTKKEGQGIGLTIVKEILLNHGFGFSLQTEAQGTTAFVIQF